MEVKPKMQRAIYAGTFDPFTNGHYDIVKQAAEIFDELYIVIAANSNKNRMFKASDMIKAIQETVSELDNNIKVLETSELVADIAKSLNCKYLIRGLRNPNDYYYEENIAKINQELNNELNTVYFRAKSDIVSSSFIKEMLLYGKDVAKYVSPPVLRIIKEYNK